MVVHSELQADELVVHSGDTVGNAVFHGEIGRYDTGPRFIQETRHGKYRNTEARKAYRRAWMRAKREKDRT